MELEGLLQLLPAGRDFTALELGCGDGFQLGLLRRRFGHVFAIDPQHAPARTSRFSFAVAEALPFANSTFDLVVSSNVIEHVEDRRRAVEEAVRVVRPGGYVAHIVPSRFWKATSLLFNPVGYPLRVAEKWRARRQSARQQVRVPASPGARLPQTPGAWQVVVRWFCPPVHGAFDSHLSEFLAFGRRRWRRALAHPRLVPVACAPLVAYTPFGFFRFRFVSLRKWLGSHGLASCHAFVMQKPG